MKLNLKNPIIFFDIESTGLDVYKDRIVEICYIKVMPNGNEESKNIRINPGMHIPEESSAIHHITDDDVKDCPRFFQIAKELAETFKGCDIAGFNSNRFDVPLLVEEFLRADVDINLHNRKFIDVQNIYHKLEQRTLSAAYKFYCKKNLDDAHSALADTRATLDVLEAQLDYYPDDLQNDIEFLADFSTRTRNADFAGRIIFNDKNEEVYNFGKHKGEKVCDVHRYEPSFYSWIMNGDFMQDTKKVLTNILMRDGLLFKK